VCSDLFFVFLNNVVQQLSAVDNFHVAKVIWFFSSDIMRLF